MIRIDKKYDISFVLSKISKNIIDIDGYPIKMDSQRYRLFRRDGVKCITCGIEGQFFYMEKHVDTDERFHFNLYAVKDDELVLMTKDHILPVSKGGKNHMINYCVMCVECNRNKGNKI